MATAADYANWIVSNKDKQGTPEFDTVSKAYAAAKEIEGVNIEAQKQYKREEKARDIEAERRNKPTTLVEKAKGVGEAALGLGTMLTGGTVGTVVGTGAAIAEQTKRRALGLPEMTDAEFEQYAQTPVEALTYQPKTQAGQEYLQAAVKPLEVMGAIAPVMNTELMAIGELAKAIKPQIAVTTAPARKAVEGAIKATGEKVAETARSAKGAVSGIAPQDTLKASMVAAAKETPAEDATAAMRRRQAAELPAPIDLTTGQATRSFAEQQFEREVAKQPELGAPIRERFMDQSEQLKNNFDALIGETGAQQIDLPSVGTTVDTALRNQSKADKAKVNAAYQKAREAGELELPTQLNTLIEEINKSGPEAENAPVLKVTKQKLVRLGLAEEGEGGVLIPKEGSLNAVEELRKSVGNSVNPQHAPDVHFGRILKEAIDKDTEGAGGALFKEARALHKETADKYKNFGLVRDILGTKRGTGDRQIAVESVFNKSVLTSSGDDLVKLKNILTSSGDEGKQAWNELRGATLRHIRDESIKGVARDERGNPIISPAQIERVISSLDKSGKLETIFGEKGAMQLRTINDVAKTLFTAPPGAVNTSNTASVILAAMDMAISGMAGMPAPILSALKLLQKNIRDNKIKARVAKALEKKLPVQTEEKKVYEINGGKF